MQYIFLNKYFSVEKFDTEESHAAQKAQKAATIKRKQLTALLAKPIFPKGFNARYPILNSDLSDPFLEGNIKEEKAVDVMKNAIEELSKAKVRKMPLYKPRKKQDSFKSPDRFTKKTIKKGGIMKKKNKMGKKFKRK